MKIFLWTNTFKSHRKNSWRHWLYRNVIYLMSSYQEDSNIIRGLLWELGGNVPKKSGFETVHLREEKEWISSFFQCSIFFGFFYLHGWMDICLLLDVSIKQIMIISLLPLVLFVIRRDVMLLFTKPRCTGFLNSSTLRICSHFLRWDVCM